GEDGAEVRRAAGRAVRRAVARAPALGAGRRRDVEELALLVAEEVVRRAPLLRLAGNQGLQDAHPRAAVALSQLHGMPGLPRRTAQARGAVVEAGRAGHS